MKLLRVLRTMVHQADFFSTTELIRYREEPDFKTFTGGIFSLAIIILLAVIFSSMSISAVNREHIEWTSQTFKDSIPPTLELPFNTFNIGVELEGFNLSSPVQYFDIVMTLFEFKGKILDKTTKIPLSTCRREDWALNEAILGNFDRMKATNWLCPDVNSRFEVAGKWASDIFTFVSIDVLKCGSSNPNATCASPEAIDEALTNIVHYSVYYINAQITPQSKQAVSYYMEDKDYIYFGKNLGSANYIFISDYNITTDNSILPYTDKETITGGIVLLPARISIQEVANNWYGSFIFRKSTDRIVYARSFTKFDTVISYIGGLFGALVGILFLMNHYTRTNFEICLGSSIYDDQDDESLVMKSINFCHYLGYLLYLCLYTIGYRPQWPTFERFHKCRVQIQRHLDIKLILDKLNFLQRAMCTICKEDKYRALHLRSKMTIAEAEKLRDYYALRPQIITTLLKRKKEKKITELKKQLQKAKNIQNSIMSPVQNIKESPFTLFTRGGKVKPENIIPEMISDNVSQEPQKPPSQEESNNEMGSNDSNNTMKFTKTTRRYILENKSILSEQPSEHQDVEEDLLMPNVVNSLVEVWKQALQGDNFSQQIWNSLDYDVRLILEHKIEKDDDRAIDMEKSDVSEPPEPSPENDGKVKWEGDSN